MKLKIKKPLLKEAETSSKNEFPSFEEIKDNQLKKIVDYFKNDSIDPPIQEYKFIMKILDSRITTGSEEILKLKKQILEWAGVKGIENDLWPQNKLWEKNKSGTFQYKFAIALDKIKNSKQFEQTRQQEIKNKAPLINALKFLLKFVELKEATSGFQFKNLYFPDNGKMKNFKITDEEFKKNIKEIKQQLKVIKESSVIKENNNIDAQIENLAIKMALEEFGFQHTNQTHYDDQKLSMSGSDKGIEKSRGSELKSNHTMEKDMSLFFKRRVVEIIEMRIKNLGLEGEEPEQPEASDDQEVKESIEFLKIFLDEQTNKPANVKLTPKPHIIQKIQEAIDILKVFIKQKQSPTSENFRRSKKRSLKEADEKEQKYHGMTLQQIIDLTGNAVHHLNIIKERIKQKADSAKNGTDNQAQQDQSNKQNASGQNAGQDGKPPNKEELQQKLEWIFKILKYFAYEVKIGRDLIQGKKKFLGFIGGDDKSTAASRRKDFPKGEAYAKYIIENLPLFIQNDKILAKLKLHYKTLFKNLAFIYPELEWEKLINKIIQENKKIKYKLKLIENKRG